VGGIAVAATATHAVSVLGQDLLAPLGIERLALDSRALAFVLIVSIATGLVTGLLPALAASDVAFSARDRGRPGRGAVRVGRAKSLVIVSQSALSLVLLCAALLLLRSFSGIADVTRNPGYRTADVWSIPVAVPQGERGSDGARERFYRGLLERVKAVTGVASCTLVNRVPVAQRVPLVEYATAASDGEPAVAGRAGYRVISAGYPGTLGLRVLYGRPFAETDASAGLPVAMVTRALAGRLGDERSAVGRRVRIAGTWRTVVGVLADTRGTVPGERPPAEVLVPHAGQYAGALMLLVHAPGSSTNFPGRLTTAIHEVAPGPRGPDVRSLAAVLRESIRGVGFVVGLTLAFAAVALLVTLVGIAGVVAHAVARRTHEVGVRLALGATRRDVLSLMVRQSAVRTAVGTALGLLLSAAATRVLPSRLFGVRPGSPLLFLSVGALFMAAGLMAALLAARRAATVDPTVALRQE
jgi:putative ABC transport system permease protein